MENEECKLVPLYHYEYRIIPQLIELSLQNLSTVDDFVSYMSNIDWILNSVLAELNLKCDFDTSELGATISAINGRIPAIIYSFPTPSRAPLAKYGAIVISDDSVEYFTLEKFEYKEDSGWVLGSTSQRGHSNYGQVADCASADEFLLLLEKMFYTKKKTIFFSRLMKKLWKLVKE